ncbi:GNAT family N-acetyltransferase [Candidatus Pacearchaeota archaeon]|nr:GNAT family N-acetyltransferase [Candidatus Pacearchaeota archaeon]
MEFTDELYGDRLILKRNVPDIELAKKIFEIVDSNREHLGKWFPWEKLTLKIEDTMKYLFDTEKKTEEGEEVGYGIYLNNEYIGNIDLFELDEKGKSGKIGYWISSKFSGNGYMTEAVKILEKEIFKKLGLNRIQIKCDERNKASKKVIEKCGYVFEGKSREDEYSEHFKDFRNTLIFSKLKSEY